MVWLGEEGDTARVAWELCKELSGQPEGLGDSKKNQIWEKGM